MPSASHPFRRSPTTGWPGSAWLAAAAAALFISAWGGGGGGETPSVVGPVPVAAKATVDARSGAFRDAAREAGSPRELPPVAEFHALSMSSSVRATTRVAPCKSLSTRCSSARFALLSSTVRGPAP